jgi:hypothetical protein
MKHILTPIFILLYKIILTLVTFITDLFYTPLYFIWSFKFCVLGLEEFVETKNEWQTDEYFVKYKNVYSAIWFPSGGQILEKEKNLKRI